MNMKNDEDMEKTILGTHNTMTYLRPARWYGWLMVPFARCQRKPIERQWVEGARCFDMRVRFTRRGDAYFAHGLYECTHGVDPYDVVVELAKRAHEEGTKVMVRLVLEDPKRQTHNEYYFKGFCAFVGGFPDLVAFQGNRKGDWAQIVEFNCHPDLRQYVGSMMDDARWWEKIMPWSYALRCNRRNRRAMEGDVAIFDFL